MGVQVHKLDADFLEGSMTEQMPLDPRESLVGIVIGLLDESQLLSLRLVQARLHAVCLFQSLQAKDEDFRIILVVQRREWDVDEFSGLKPVYGGRENGHGLLWRHVWPVLEVIVLPLLLSLEVESGKPAQVLFANCLINSGSPPDPLSVVVSGVGPPVCFGFDVSDDHILYRSWQAGDFPRDICLPTSPSLSEVLQNGFRFVGFDAIRHHIVDVHDYCSPELEIIL